MKNVDLKDFIREFVNKMPRRRNKNLPIISLEFHRRGNEYYSRIDIYRIESLRILFYRYSGRDGAGGSGNLMDWSLKSGEYFVTNILPPSTRNKSIFSRPGDSLAVIQVV